MNYLDANIFIYAATNDDEKGDISRDILYKVANNKLDACTSFLTWDEVVHIIRRLKNIEIASMEGRKFLHFPRLMLIRVDEKIMALAQNLISKYNIKPRDAIHSATAILHGDKKIISDDSDFDKINEIKRIKVGKG